MFGIGAVRGQLRVTAVYDKRKRYLKNVVKCLIWIASRGHAIYGKTTTSPFGADFDEQKAGNYTSLLHMIHTLETDAKIFQISA